MDAVTPLSKAGYFLMIIYLDLFSQKTVPGDVWAACCNANEAHFEFERNWQQIDRVRIWLQRHSAVAQDSWPLDSDMLDEW